MQVLAQDLTALWRMKALVWIMVRREVAARHVGTALGIAWPYMQPLLSVAAYYLVFDIVFAMKLGEGAPTKAVGAFLIVGALPWMAFCDAVSRGMNSLIEAGSILQKNALPPVIFPVRTVLASALIYGPLMLMVALAYASAHGFPPAILALLPLWMLQLVLGAVLGYLLAILAAALRDTVQFVGFLLSVGIYLSPILFPLTLFPEDWRWILWLNPVTAFVMGYQSILLQGEWPAISVWLGILVWLGCSMVVLNVLIDRSREQLVDWL